MTQQNPIRDHRVDILEYERGWGSRVDESIYFDTEQEARDYATTYNKTHNTAPTAPDWYMVAVYAEKR